MTETPKSTRWARENPSRMRELRALWRKNNPGRVRILQRGQYARNLATARARSARWAKNNPEKIRAAYWKRKHGITPEQVYSLLREQNGVCAICLKPVRLGRNLHIDHSPLTQKVRGILCGKCNLGLGLFCDSPANLTLAIQYLEKHFL